MERACPICEKLYDADLDRLWFGRQTTCSRDCSYRFRGLKTTKAIEVKCAVCGIPLRRAPSHLNSPNSFCSKKCHYAGRSLGLSVRPTGLAYKITEEGREKARATVRQNNRRRFLRGGYSNVSAETRQKISVGVTQAIVEGRMTRPSKLEGLVRGILERLDLTYEAQWPIRGDDGRYAAVIDFYLPSQNTALEVNGTFWHVDPRKYPDGPTHRSQRRTLNYYARKIKLLAAKNITLTEVWEIDLHLDPEAAVRKALGLPYA